MPKDDPLSKDPALLHMETRLLVRDMPVVSDMVVDDLVFEGSRGLLDFGLRGSWARVVMGDAAKRGLFEVAQEVMSALWVEGLLEGNNCFASSGLVVKVAGATAPLALSLALPNMV
jgi:hypothetical protein